jgi:glutamate synthase (NADPH/NADH) small chain
MGKVTGFLEYERKNGEEVPSAERIHNFEEFHGSLTREEQQLQGARCMDCGVPFCQAGMDIGGMTSGCPLHNLVPELNDLVYHGNWEQAYIRLSKTHSFPEFTSRVCPALCEAACTCGLHSAPVSTKENEKAVIEYAYEHGLVKPDEVKTRTGKKVAVIGSGPSGLAAAAQLNKRGHQVTVYERHDHPGGLLYYGIPNMKLDKEIVNRRIRLMEESGIQFICNTDVGKDISAKELLDKYDRVILACGASNPRDINVPGRQAEGIWFAVDFLSQVTHALLEQDKKDNPWTKGGMFDLAGKKVLVIGGGDTGNDCVGTAIRLGAENVLQLEMMPKAPEQRTDSNPWPQWPRVLKTDYGQQEAIQQFGKDPRVYQTTVTGFLADEKGRVRAAITQKLQPVKDEKTGRTLMKPVEGSEQEVAVDLVLIAAGFLGCQGYIAQAFGVECNERTNVKTSPGSHKTNVDRVFTAGDMHRGQSLVVWAIAEGRSAAAQVDESMMGYTNL